MFDPMQNNSPFDINMALDCDFDVLMPYSNVRLESIGRLTQDVIFSRGPSGVKQTAIFIGGRDLGVAVDMLNGAKKAMVPPFEVSVFADPSGAFTTAAALVACVEKELKEKHNKALKDCKALVFGGTGPVGIATGVTTSQVVETEADAKVDQTGEMVQRVTLDPEAEDFQVSLMFKVIEIVAASLPLLAPHNFLLATN
jgi:methylene-tetrahydromethanopterin dehydrogenase